MRMAVECRQCLPHGSTVFVIDGTSKVDAIMIFREYHWKKVHSREAKLLKEKAENDLRLYNSGRLSLADYQIEFMKMEEACYRIGSLPEVVPPGMLFLTREGNGVRVERSHRRIPEEEAIRRNVEVKKD